MALGRIFFISLYLLNSSRDLKMTSLRPHMTRLAAPRVDAVVEALEDALLSLPPAEVG